MRFTLSIDMDNAAFEDPDELPRILARVTSAVRARSADGLLPLHTRTVMDSNGNRVGGWKIGETDD